MLPSPSTRVPFVQIATLREIIVYCAASSGWAAIAVHTRATPGVYTSRISWTVRTGERATIFSLPSMWRKQRPVLVPEHADAVELVDQLGDAGGLRAVPDLDRDVPHRMLAPEREGDHVPDQPFAVGDRLRDSGQLSGAVGYLDAIGAVEHRLSLSLSQRGSRRGCIYHVVTPGPPSPEPVPPLHQLYPEQRLIAVRTLLEELNLAAKAPTERPYTIVNFVASADGHAAYRGRSRWLSDDADRELFHGLREHVDAILVGTGTLRIERYGRLIRDPERRHRRAASGLAPDPLACIFSRSGDVPTDIPLFDDPASRIVVFSPIGLDTSGLAAGVEVVRLDPGQLTLTTMMRRLRSTYDVHTCCARADRRCSARCCRKTWRTSCFVSQAPKLTGGGNAPSITSGPELADLRSLDLVWVLELASALYLRYTIR